MFVYTHILTVRTQVFLFKANYGTAVNADALFSVGYMYDYGEGSEEDNPTALKWYTQAAQKGQLFRFLYLYGDDGVNINIKKGLGMDDQIC